MFIKLPSIYLRQLKNAVTSDDVCGRLLPNKSLLTHFKLMELVNRLGAPCTHKLATHTNDVKAVCRLAPLYDHLSEFGIIIQMHLVCLRSFCTYQAHSNWVATSASFLFIIIILIMLSSSSGAVLYMHLKLIRSLMLHGNSTHEHS